MILADALVGLLEESSIVGDPVESQAVDDVLEVFDGLVIHVAAEGFVALLEIADRGIVEVEFGKGLSCFGPEIGFGLGKDLGEIVEIETDVVMGLDFDLGGSHCLSSLVVGGFLTYEGIILSLLGEVKGFLEKI